MRTIQTFYWLQRCVLACCLTALLNARGDLPLDPTFNSPAIQGGYLSSMAILPDSRVLLATGYASINGTIAGAIVRLTPGGALDASFTPPAFENGPITAILPVSDGSAYIAGSFLARTGNVTRTGLAKLTPEGFLDTSVVNLRELGGQVQTMIFDSKGRIVIGGGFVLNRARSKANIVRVLPTGAVDETLNPTANNEAARPTVNGQINKIIALEEGKMLIGGSFTTVGGFDRFGLARLEESGAADPSFDFVVEHDCCIADIALAADGKILVAGTFRNFAGRGLAGIVRINPDATLDESFQSPLGPIAMVNRIALLDDGAIAAAGTFSQAASTNHLAFGRFLADGQMDTAWRDIAVGQVYPEQVLSDPAGHIFLLKRRWISDALPQEYSLEKLAAQPPTHFAPRILTQNRDVSALEGQTVLLAMDDVAHPRPTYQWQLNSGNLPEGTNRILRMPAVSPTASGAYRLMISNSLGTTFSEPIQLRVEPARIAPGQVDFQFDPRPGLFGNVQSTRKTVEGKVLMWGSFSRVAGALRWKLARLNQDGTLDETFVPETKEFDSIFVASPSTNDSTVVLGTVLISNNSRTKVIRLTSTGALDTTFKPYLSPINTWLQTIHAADDAKVYVSGSYDGSFVGVFRLLPNGTRETAYRLRLEGFPAHIIGQPDGKMVLAGGFRTPLAERQQINLARLNANGTLDESFFPGSTLVNVNPESVAVAPDGSIIVSIPAYFSSRRGVSTTPIPIPPEGPLLRFLTDGTWDSSFNLEWDDLELMPLGNSALTIQPDGSIIAAVVPTQYFEPYPFSLIRFFPDGTRDYGFDRISVPSFGNVVLSSLTGDRLLLTGEFPSVNGLPRTSLARIYAQPSAPNVPAFLRQPEGSRLPEGAELTLSPAINATIPRSFQWQKNQVNLAGETNRTLGLKNLKVADSGNYQLIAANNEGSTISAVATVQVDPARTTPGAVDVSFYAGSGPNGPVNQVIELPEGKLMVHGNFDSFDGRPHARIARLHADGTLDDSFAPPYGPNNEVATMLVLDDGGILIAGPFDMIGTNSTPNFALLKSDGTLDKAGINSGRFPYPGRVNQFLKSPDGQRIFACGEGFVNCWKPDGTADATFESLVLEGQAVSMALQPDGKLLIVGNFAFNSNGRLCIARINSDGKVDATFNPGAGSHGASILDVALQPDRKIVVVGFFREFNGVRRGCIARLHSDGTVDPTFDAIRGAADGRIVVLGHFGMRDATAVHSVAIDGERIIITGEFTTYDGVPVGRIVRLFADGSLDPVFDIGSGLHSPETIGLQNLYDAWDYPSARWVGRAQKSSDGKILFGGHFLGMHGVSRPRLMKVHGGNVPDGIPQVRSTSMDLVVRHGTNIVFFVDALASPRPSFQWYYNGQLIPGATRASLELNNISRADAGEYSCTVSNGFGTVRHVAGRVDVSPPRRETGAVDPGFYFDRIQDFFVNTAIIQSDGKIQAAGFFNMFNAPQRPMWVRVNPDGSLDAALHSVSTNLRNGNFDRIIPLEDGSTLLHGYFEIQKSPTVTTNGNWFRILPNGAAATNYPALPSMSIAAVGRWTNGQPLIAQNDPIHRLIRLDSNATMDNTFPRITFNGAVLQIVVDEQGRILLAGDFTLVNSVRRNRVARLNPDGTLDQTFDPKTGPDGSVSYLALQPGGDLILGGWFNRVNNFSKPFLARLHSDGSLDPVFPADAWNYSNNGILGLHGAEDGSFVLAGYFTEQTDIFDLVRYKPDGTQEERASTTSQWYQQGRFSQNLQLAGFSPTGKVVLYGTFSHVADLPRTDLVRLLSEKWPRVFLKPASADGSFTLIWDEGVVEEAESVSGPWQPSQNAASPRHVTPGNGGSFYRLRVDE